jgi:hypothetical protein
VIQIFQVLEHSKEIERHAFMMEDVQYTRKRILALLVRQQQLRQPSLFNNPFPRNAKNASSSSSSTGPLTISSSVPRNSSSRASAVAQQQQSTVRPSRRIDDDDVLLPRGPSLVLTPDRDGRDDDGDGVRRVMMTSSAGSASGLLATNGGDEFLTMDSLAAQAEAELSIYEMKLAQAFELDISPWDDEPRYHWNFVQSVFFASTVITSIGESPKTSWLQKAGYQKNETCWYPPITYYRTVPLIFDHSYLVGKLSSSKIANTNVSGFQRF